MMETKLVLLGTGTPNACPDASGPSSAVVVGDRAYLVDFGPGVVRQAAKAYRNGIDALRPDRLVTAFCTHLHTDHTAGYPDLIFTPWVLERKEPLRVFGPKGIRDMTEHLLKAYKVDIDFRINGFEKANEVGYRVETQEINSGVTLIPGWSSSFLSPLYAFTVTSKFSFSGVYKGTINCNCSVIRYPGLSL